MNADNNLLEIAFTRIYVVFLVIMTVFSILCTTFAIVKVAVFGSYSIPYSGGLEGLYIAFTFLMLFNVALSWKSAYETRKFFPMPRFERTFWLFLLISWIIISAIYHSNTKHELDSYSSCASPDGVCRIRFANLFFLFVELVYLIILSMLIYIILFLRHKNGRPDDEVYIFKIKDLFNRNKKGDDTTTTEVDGGKKVGNDDNNKIKETDNNDKNENEDNTKVNKTTGNVDKDEDENNNKKNKVGSNEKNDVITEDNNV